MKATAIAMLLNDATDLIPVCAHRKNLAPGDYCASKLASKSAIPHKQQVND
jgi:hypothetical protein